MSEYKMLTMEYQATLSKEALIELLEATNKTIEGTEGNKFKVKVRIKEVK